MHKTEEVFSSQKTYYYSLELSSDKCFASTKKDPGAAK